MMAVKSRLFTPPALTTAIKHDARCSVRVRVRVRACVRACAFVCVCARARACFVC